MKKIGRFLASMKFAVILLVVLALACTAGSFVTQGQTYDWYARVYGERFAALIIALSLDDAFHSWWFVLITGFLCLNLLLCNVLRLPHLIKRSSASADPMQMCSKVEALMTAARGDEAGLPEELQDSGDEQSEAAQIPKAGAGSLVCGTVTDPQQVFSGMHMPKVRFGETKSGKEWRFCAKNTAGIWGAWVCHLGILLLIAGFGLGQMTKKEYTVFGVSGQTRPIGDTEYELTIDDFRVSLREDDTVEQYTADITVSPAGAGDEMQKAQVSVNNPATLYGMKFYQNSTGWAARVTVTENGEELQDEIICAGEYLPVADKPELVVYLNAFYPDYVKDGNGMPSTASGKLNNPAYLYTVYYQGSVLGMNVLMQDEDLTIDDYTVRFSEPQSYTLIQVKKDSFTWLALIGGIITMSGLLLAFYLLPERLLSLRLADGTWLMAGESRKGGSIYRKRFEKVLRASGGRTTDKDTPADSADSNT